MLLSQLLAPFLGAALPQWDAEWGMGDAAGAIPKGVREKCCAFKRGEAVKHLKNLLILPCLLCNSMEIVSKGRQKFTQSQNSAFSLNPH